jgi:hypothetical protein
MTKNDIRYIHDFIDEIEALYEADVEAEFIPEYIEDYVKNIRVILHSEETQNNV